MLVAGAQDADPLPLPEARVERLRLAALVVADEGVGRGHHVLGGTEVLAEGHGDRALETLLEFKDVPDVRPAPAVDRLVRVAHHADVPVRARDVPRDGELRAVRVLVLVDEHVAIPVARDAPQFLVALEREGHAHQEVVEVERLVALEDLLVRLVRLRHLARGEVGRVLAEHRGIHQLVLGVADLRVHRGRLEVLRVEACVDERALHRRALVVGVVDDEVRVHAALHRVTAKEHRAERMERAHHQAATAGNVGREHRLHALLHLARSLVGERERQDLPRRNAERHQARHTTRDDARLAGARARDHEERTIHVRHRRALVVGQAFEELVRVQDRHGSRKISVLQGFWFGKQHVDGPPCHAGR